MLRTKGRVGNGVTAAERANAVAHTLALVASTQGSVSDLCAAGAMARQVAQRPVPRASTAALHAVVVACVLIVMRIVFNTRMRGCSRVGRSRLREAANYLPAGSLSNSDEARPRAFMVTSSVGREGKATITVEFAESFGLYGYHAVLMDADHRSHPVLECFPQVCSLGTFATSN